MSRRRLTVDGINYENGHTTQTLNTNAFEAGAITRQKGGGRRHYVDDNYVAQYSNRGGRQQHYVSDERSYATYHNSSYAHNSDSTDAQTERDTETSVTTSSSKDRQRKRKNHRRRTRTYDDSVYKAVDDCDYKQRKNAADTKNCQNQVPRSRAGEQSGNYLEDAVNYAANKSMPTNAATINENTGTTKEMLRFMDKLFRTLGDVKNVTTTNSIAPTTRQANASKLPKINENTSKTNQGEQNYARFGMHLPQQIVYQTHITHVPTQNTHYATLNKNSLYAQNAQAEKTFDKCVQQAEYRQIPELATTATAQPHARVPEKAQPAQFTTQRYAFPQYPCVTYTQPTPLALAAAMPQACMPGASRQPIAYAPPPTAAATQASIQTLPPGMYKSHVEEYVRSRTPQVPALQKTSPTVQSLEQSDVPAQFNTNQQSFITQQPTQSFIAEGRKQNTDFSLLRNSREHAHQIRQPASASNQYVRVNDGTTISGTASNNNELRYNGFQQQYARVENSVEEAVKLNRTVQAYNVADIENKANESSTIEQEETKHINSETLEDEANHGKRKDEQIKANGGSSKPLTEKASRRSRKGERTKTNREGKSKQVGANKKSKLNAESKYSNKRESTPETNSTRSTDNEMQRKTSSSSSNSDYLRECLRRKRTKNKNKRKNQRHGDSFSDSDCDETSNGYSEYSSNNRSDTRRKRHAKYARTDSESGENMQYSLSRTSCKELKKCCSRIVAICRMARDTAGTQTEQWEDGASLQLQRSNKLADGLPKSIADGLAAAHPRVAKRIMPLNRDRRKCRVCACGMMDATGAPVVKDDMYILKFDDNEPKLPTHRCMERRSRCTCNCGCNLSDTESEIIREIIRKKRLQEKSKRINALRQNKYDSCDCYTACDYVDEEDEREFIASLLRKQRRERDRERDRTQAQNMYEDCVCDCASKAKELAAEIMHEMVKSHIQKIVTDELEHKTRLQENQKGVENASRAGVCTCNSDESPTVKPKTERVQTQAGVCTCDSDERPTVRPKSERMKPQMFECTCESDDSQTPAPKSERIAPQSGVCTCESDEIPIVVPKSERTKPRNSECTCDPIESRTITQTFTRTIELQSGGGTKNEMASPKRLSNDSPESAKKKRKTVKKQRRNSKSSKSAEDNEEEYTTFMQNNMATERKSDESSKDVVSKSDQGSRRNSQSYSDKNAIDPQVNDSSSSVERPSLSTRKDKSNQLENFKRNAIKKSVDEEYMPSSYYEDRIQAQRKITVKTYQAGPPKPTKNELKRCRDDCACKETATQPKTFRTTKAKKDLRTCRADCACKQAIEPAFNDLEEYALSNSKNMERTMLPEYNNSDEHNSLRADSGDESIQKLIIDIKASKKAHATIPGHPKSKQNAERNTQASLDSEAQSSDTGMLLEQRAALCAELTMNELLPQHSLRTLLTKLSSPDGKLYNADAFNAQPEESLRLAKINQSKMLNMPRTGKNMLSPTTVMTQSLRLSGKQSKSATDTEVAPSQLVSGNRQLKPPVVCTPSTSESCGLSAVESALQQQKHNKRHVTNRQDGFSNKFARKSRIPLPVYSNTCRTENHTKLVAKSSSAEKRANQRPLIDQKSDSNQQITRLWPEQAAIAAQRLRQEKTVNTSNEQLLDAKQIKKSQSNIERSCGFNYSSTRPRLESGRHEESPKLSSQESQISAISQLKTENTKKVCSNLNAENTQLKILNILSAANQCATSSSGRSSESCKTDDSQTQNEQRCARCRAFYKKTGAHQNIKELQKNAKRRINYVPQTRRSTMFIPATIHATTPISDDEQTDSDIECITVEYSGSDGDDSYTQYQDELLRKQQLWRKGTVKEALEVEERAERVRNLQRTTLTGENLERAIHYPTRVWNEERKQLNLQRNGVGIFLPL